MPIHLLPAEVASQIAAGEVVERPASVVKELLENALDAEATQITIMIEGAGKRLIEVADNGVGMPADELRLAVERHATSKLNNAEDLFHIQTLGFRGEALASIGSVSRLTITSCTTSGSQGARLRVEGGMAGSVQPVGAPAGTVVRVEDLFSNVPARLKFLKQESTERRHIDNLVTRYALAYPRVRFTLIQEGRPAIQTSGNGNPREILSALYGPDTARQMIEVLAEDDLIQVRGFISPTSVTRTNRREITCFVNGRPVQDNALTTALIQGYHTLLMVGRYPMAVLFIRLPAEAVDVNVHPTKAEVRFRDADAVFRGVQRAVRGALLAHAPVPELVNQLRWSPAGAWNAPPRQIDPGWEMAAELDEGKDVQVSLPLRADQARLPGSKIPLLRLVGQIAATYLVAEGPDGLYLIDQHAAHERILFEKYSNRQRADVQSGSAQYIPAQVLLEPAAVTFPPAAQRLIESQLSSLEQLGYQIEAFGPGTYLVRAIPVLLAGMNPASAVYIFVEDFEEDEAPLQNELETRMIARICKRAAVKSGQILTVEEQKMLLEGLEACQSPRTCPHGRPTMIHLSVDLLERQFGRRGAR